MPRFRFAAAIVALLVGHFVPANAESTAPLAALPPNDAVAAGCAVAPQAYLRARLRGASTLDVDWRGADLQCDGGVRPDGHGIRLTFAGTDPALLHHVRFVFGIDVAPKSRTAHAVPANVTVIFEGEHKLYSTRGSRCTVDELHSQPATAAGQRLLRVTARGFCVTEAQALDGGPGLLVTRFDFLGAVPLQDHDR